MVLRRGNQTGCDPGQQPQEEEPRSCGSALLCRTEEGTALWEPNKRVLGANESAGAQWEEGTDTECQSLLLIMGDHPA